MTRLLDCFADAGHVQLLGVPYDVSVIGRKGARHGPKAIREAFRFIGGHHLGGHSFKHSIVDHGDLELPASVKAAHDQLSKHVETILAKGPTVILGGDHGLTFAHVRALANMVGGRIGIVVIDAHYDLRSYTDEPTSGTPFRRILEEMYGRVHGEDIVEIGIRDYANAPELADVAARYGVHIMHANEARNTPDLAGEVLAKLGHVDHLWLSIDIDGFDQSIAAGCSAPGAGGLLFHDVAPLIEAVASDPRARGMDVLEVAPEYDPTGNTARTAAQCVAHFVGALPAPDPRSFRVV